MKCTALRLSLKVAGAVIAEQTTVGQLIFG